MAVFFYFPKIIRYIKWQTEINRTPDAQSSGSQKQELQACIL